MRLDEFEIGGEFVTGVDFRGRRVPARWRCTDIGSRVVVAIRIDEVRVGNPLGLEHVLDHRQADRQGWFNGPPYAVAERVFDENDLPACTPCL